MKIHKRRNLFGLIYALVMLLPLSSVLFRCAYTIFNKNAFESYYGDNINQITYTPIANLKDDLDLGQTYYLSKNEANIQSSSNIGSYVTAINVTNVHIISTSVTLTINEEDIVSIAPYYNAQYYGNKIDISLRTANNSQIVSYANELILTFDYQGNNLTSNWTNANFIFNINYNKYSYLDNAFEYSLDTFIGNNGRGVLNLTDWFTDVFLQRSSHTMLYLDFVNWYMNYTLLISCVYLLYLVLMWFISLARRILTKYEEV